MFKKLFSLAALSLLVVGVQGVFAQDVTSSAYGDSFNGKIADPEDGILYSFEGSEGDEVVIQASSNKIDVYLRLGNEDGDILAENDDISGDDLNAKIEYMLEDDGLYYYAVLGYDPGSYTVSLENANANSGASSDIIPVSYGDSITGEAIDMDNPVIYAFDGIEGQQVNIVASSDEVDTYLIVVDAEANIVAENDDTSKKNTDASVEFSLPSTGVFLVGVLADHSGPFELVIDSARIGSNNDGTTNISDEEPVGDLYYGTVDDETPFNHITLEDIPEGATITVDIRSTSGDLDAYGGILFGDDIVAENDDRSRNDSNPILEFKVEEAGEYTIIITRAGFEDGNTSGDFDAVVNISGVSKTVILDQVAFDTDGSRTIIKPIFRGFNPAGDGAKVENPLLGGVDSPVAPQQ